MEQVYRVLEDFVFIDIILFPTIYASLFVNILYNNRRRKEPLNLGVFTTLISFPLSAVGPSNAFMIELS